MNTKKTTADAVYEYLGSQPGAHTLDAVSAALPDVKKPTLSKALTALVEAGQIRTVETDGATAWTADAEPAQASSTTDAVASVNSDNRDTAPVGPNPHVIALAFVLARATSGLTAEAVAAGSGIAIDTVWQVLAAMHAQQAATCDRAFILDPAALWTAGAADPMTVDLAIAPDTVECPMCGNQAPVPGRKTTRKRSSGAAGSAGLYEPVRDMGVQVEAWLKSHPDQDVTPGQISKALRNETQHPNPNAYSSGAIRNVLFKLVQRGELSEVTDAAQLTFHTPASRT